MLTFINGNQLHLTYTSAPHVFKRNAHEDLFVSTCFLWISEKGCLLTNICSSFSLKQYHFASTALQGFNATLNEPVDALGRAGQIRELEHKLHSNTKEPLKKLSDDPKTTIVVLSGSGRAVLDKVLSRKLHVFLDFQQQFLSN